MCDWKSSIHGSLDKQQIVISDGYTDRFTPQVYSSCTGHHLLANPTYICGRQTGGTSASREVEVAERLSRRKGGGGVRSI